MQPASSGIAGSGRLRSAASSKRPSTRATSATSAATSKPRSEPWTRSSIADLRIVACEACGTEGRVLVTVPGQWDPEDRGPCPYCEGTGGEIITTQPIEMEDLDEGRAA